MFIDWSVQAMKLVQHIPMWAEATPWVVEDWNGDPESVPQLRDWGKEPGWVGWHIHDNCLMAVYEQGRKWWVVANFGLGKPNLPNWKGPVTE